MDGDFLLYDFTGVVTVQCERDTVSQFDKWGIIMKMAFLKPQWGKASFQLWQVSWNFKGQCLVQRDDTYPSCLDLLAGLLWFPSKMQCSLSWAMTVYLSWTEMCRALIWAAFRSRRDTNAGASRSRLSAHCHSSWTQGNNRPCISDLSRGYSKVRKRAAAPRGEKNVKGRSMTLLAHLASFLILKQITCIHRAIYC